MQSIDASLKSFNRVQTQLEDKSDFLSKLKEELMYGTTILEYVTVLCGWEETASTSLDRLMLLQESVVSIQKIVGYKDIDPYSA